MSPGWQVELREVWAMLDACAPGHSRAQKLHHWWIAWGGKTFRTFPLGAHGHRRDAEIQGFHVRKLVRFLGIPEDCARRLLPFL